MGNLEKAFSSIAKGTKIRAFAKVKSDRYKGTTKIVIDKIWNGKIAIYKHGHDADMGYMVFQNEDAFFDVVEITELDLDSSGAHAHLKKILEPVKI